VTLSSQPYLVKTICKPISMLASRAVDPGISVQPEGSRE